MEPQSSSQKEAAVTFVKQVSQSVHIPTLTLSIRPPTHPRLNYQLLDGKDADGEEHKIFTPLFISRELANGTLRDDIKVYPGNPHHYHDT